MPKPGELTRRERQIMDVLLERGEASAEQVRAALPDPPSNSAVRTLLGKLEEKGHVHHEARDLRYVYAPVAQEEARESAVSRLVRVFFGGSAAQAVSGLLDQSAERIDDDELDRLAEAIEAERRRRAER